jgi:pimeloyl-ACP methyl ester carboxylesterase
MKAYITVDQLSLIKAPTLVMAGDHDMVKEKHTRTIAENIPQSKLVIFKDASHFVPVEKVSEFNNTVLEFFDGK